MKTSEFFGFLKFASLMFLTSTIFTGVIILVTVNVCHLFGIN